MKNIFNHGTSTLLIFSSSVVSANGFLLYKSVPSLDRPDLKQGIGGACGECSMRDAVSMTRGGGESRTTPGDERAKANEVMIYCAKITALSAAIDLAVTGSDLFTGLVTGKWIFPLTTLWKISFSFNMWRVSKLYKEKIETLSELYQLYERFMISMTGIWRRMALMITLLTLEDVVFVWKASLPNIRLVLNALYGAVAIISIQLSAKETERLIMDQSTSQSSTDKDTSVEKLVRLGRVTVRAMLLGISALLLDAIMTPLIALRKTRTEGIVVLLDLLTSIPFMTLLWKLRQSYIVFIEDLFEGSNKGRGNGYLIQPETQVQLFRAQQNFWGKLKSFHQTTIFFKVVAIIAQLQLVQKLTGLFVN